MNKTNEIPVTYDEVKSNERIKVIAQNGNTGKHYMTEFRSLEKRINNWAKDKGILEKSTPLDQIDKTIEEVLELREALVAQNNNLEYYINSKGVKVNTQEQIIDGIGDIDVTIKIQSKMQNLDPLACLESVVNIIEKRNGKMINGKFVKTV